MAAIANVMDKVDIQRSGLRAFFRISELWQLTQQEQRRLLGDPPLPTFLRWRREGGKLSRDTAERISYVLGIFQAINILLPNPLQADGWVHRSNDASPFFGRSALSRMLAGNVSDLFVVRQYLDTQCS